MIKRQRYDTVRMMIKNLVLTGTGFLCFVLMSSKTFAQAWYNNNWSYRKSHVITGSAGAGTGYQIRIIVHKTTGTDAGSDVYMGANPNNDFGDVRFTASDGTTLLSYWMETGSLTSGSQAAFWVKVAADLGSNQTIYVYYGNGSATTTSNGANTFILFDDFDGTSLDASKWTKRNGGTPSFASGMMTISSNAVDPSKIIATGGPNADNNAIVARFKVTGGVNSDERVGLGIRTPNTATPLGYNFLFHDFSALNAEQFLNDGSAWGNSFTFSWQKNTFYTMEAFTNGTNLYGRVNYSTWNTQPLAGFGTARATNFLALNIGSFDATTAWDWAFIRKSIATEPVNSNWSAEQSVPPAITSFSPASGCQGIGGIVITGSNFTGATSVNFNGVLAAYTVNNATQITATVPLSATTGAISVTTPGGTTASPSSFTVNALPVSSITNQTNITCFAANNGTVTVSASNGSSPYTFSVDNGATFLTATGTNLRLFAGLLPNTPYRIKVKDNNGCISK